MIKDNVIGFLKSIYSHFPSGVKDFLFLSRINRKISEVEITAGENTFKLSLITNEAAYQKVQRTEVYEPMATKMILEKMTPDDTFIDLGSGQGYFSFLAASITKHPERVHAFDPHRIWGEIFLINNQRYLDGKINFNRAWVGDGAASVQTLTRYRVMTDKELTLDDYCKLGNVEPTFVKMDIEGGEVCAIKGMQNILERLKPKLLIEMHPSYMEDLHGVSATDFVADIEAFGYTVLYTENFDDPNSSWKESIDTITDSTMIYCAPSS